MSYQDHQVDLTINQLSQQKFEELSRNGTIHGNEIYYILENGVSQSIGSPIILHESVALNGHTHPLSEITGWENEILEFPTIKVSSLTVDGSQVSLEGHTHYLSEISDINGANLNLGLVSASSVSASSITLNGLQIATESYVDSEIATIEPDSKVFVTDSTINWSQSKTDLNVVKVTPSEYQNYINNYTQEELANYVFIVSSNVEDMLGKRVTNVGTPTSSTDAATKGYVDSALDGFTPASSGRATDDYIQLIKPVMDGARLFVEISFYTDFEMTTPAFTIDSNNVTNLQYFRAYHNSGDSRSWLVPDAGGLTTDYDYAPVCVLVKNYMTNNNITADIKCASFYWYWVDDSHNEHRSDVCSSIFPATSELNMGKLFGYEEMETVGTTIGGEQVRFKMLVKLVQ